LKGDSNMPDKSDDSVKALYAAERAAERAKHKNAPGTPPSRRRTETSIAPNTPVSNHAGAGLASPPHFGNKGAPSANNREVIAKAATRPKQARASIARGPIDESQYLDAYWASFGQPGTRALLRQGLMRQPILEVVIGTDDRTQVGDTDQYPWCCIASLLITANNGTNWIGTGWLVGPRILLTAGHCVYMADQGGWVSQIEVIPGRDGDNRPFQSCFASDFRSTNGWLQSSDRDYDYGAILLPAENRYGDQLGWFGYEVRGDSDLQNLLVNLSGYPGDKPSGTQWFHKNNIAGVNDQILTYQIDTAGGQSGAPVWVKKDDGSRYGIGVHTNGDLTGNSATRITQQVYDNITSWRAEVP
jgi:glutamyl endopeptidase